MPVIVTKKQKRELFLKQKNQNLNQQYILSRSILPKQRIFEKLDDLVAYLKCGIGARIGKTCSRVANITTVEEPAFYIVLIRFASRRDDVSIWYRKNLLKDEDDTPFSFFPDLTARDYYTKDGVPSERLTLFCDKIDQRISKFYIGLDKADNDI